MLKVLPPPRRLLWIRREGGRSFLVFLRTGVFSWSTTRPPRRQSSGKKQSHPRRNGWLIIFILSRNNCAQFATICRQGTITNYLSSLQDTWKDIRGYLEWHGRTSRTLTAGLNRTSCDVS